MLRQLQEWGRQGCTEKGRAVERRGEMWKGGQGCGEQDAALGLA